MKGEWLDRFYRDVRGSFMLALRRAGVPGRLIRDVARTVDDYVGNHYGEEGDHSLAAAFPFRVLAFMGEDGQPVVEIETSGTAEGQKRFHDSHAEPYLRVYVNDARVSEYTGPEPWGRDRLARLVAGVGARPAPERGRGR